MAWLTAIPQVLSIQADFTPEQLPLAVQIALRLPLASQPVFQLASLVEFQLVFLLFLLVFQFLVVLTLHFSALESLISPLWAIPLAESKQPFMAAWPSPEAHHALCPSWSEACPCL